MALDIERSWLGCVKFKDGRLPCRDFTAVDVVAMEVKLIGGGGGISKRNSNRGAQGDLHNPIDTRIDSDGDTNFDQSV